MSETRVVLDTKQWDIFFSKLEGKMKAIGNILMSAVTLYAYQDIMDHFAKEEGPDGRWADRKEPYKSYIERKGYTKILQVTGNLRQSISFSKLGPSSVKVIANAPYSGRLDEGSGSMPARPFMWLSDSAQDKILDTIMKLATEGA